MGKKRVPIKRETSIEDAVSDAMSKLEELKSEMADWASNMEGANMEHMPKYEEVTEARCALEDLEGDDPALPDELPEGLIDLITWMELPPLKRGLGRNARCADAASGLRRAAEHVEAFLEEARGNLDVDADEPESYETLETFAERCSEIAEEAEGVSFPGMY